MRRVDILLDRLAVLAGPGPAASATAVLIVALVLAGFGVGAATGGVHGEAWGAAAALAAFVLAGLLYAWRLGAYGPPE